MNSAELKTNEDARARRQAIGEALVAVFDEAFGRGLRGIVLTGSVARGEETVLTGPFGDTMLSDVECIVVLDDGVRLPEPAASEALCRAIELRLASRRVQTRVSAAIVHQNYLRELPLHIFSYELKACGKVLHGEPDLLRLIPACDVAELSREDAWRMLSNRMIEQLELVQQLREEAGTLSDSLHYATVKLCLDLATSMLVFLGEYAPTYRGREARFRRLASSPSASCLPFPAAKFAACLRQCTDWKLAPQQSPRERDPQFWFEIVGYARQAWLWELGQLDGFRAAKAATGQAESHEVQSMVRQLARLQGGLARLRGWAYVIRRRGWLRSVANWPRWLRLGMRYSPRYATYFAAFQVFDWLPEHLRHATFTAGLAAMAPPAGGEADLDLRRVSELLPCRFAKGHELSTKQVIAEITANYHEFVTGTRA